MIGEPELTGASAGVPSRRPELADVVRDPGVSDRRGPARGPWLKGALSGAAAVCAVWAGTASAAGSPAPGPDLHGLRIGSSPCAGATFGALERAVGAGGADGVGGAGGAGGAGGVAVAPAVFSHGPALDSARCEVSVQAPPRRGADATTRYDVTLTVDLHKATDPRPEFDDQHALDPVTLAAAERTTELTGLGDEAYALALADGSEAVRVLRGGAVITLRLTTSAVSTGPAPAAPPPSAAPEPSDLAPALADAARTLIAALAT
ncbi:hypothetical protein [Actinacidiphila yeochonensis]|uniref:hypothetical protein n=1 Tax=Actinacidiphila yeochonensis TaxID=89050 RepID=UPI00068E6D13|nr:hypothetical protein [Actinacidiphila yeochonensis]